MTRQGADGFGEEVDRLPRPDRDIRWRRVAVVSVVAVALVASSPSNAGRFLLVVVFGMLLLFECNRRPTRGLWPGAGEAALLALCVSGCVVAGFSDQVDLPGIGVATVPIALVVMLNPAGDRAQRLGDSPLPRDERVRENGGDQLVAHRATLGAKVYGGGILWFVTCAFVATVWPAPVLVLPLVGLGFVGLALGFALVRLRTPMARP